MFLLKEQASQDATLDCIARYILSIVVDREIDEKYNLGKPMNEYEYDNCISDFKLTCATIYCKHSASTIVAALKTIIRKTACANNEKLVYGAGDKYTDRFVYVFNEKVVSERDVGVTEVKTIVFGEDYFICTVVNDTQPPLKYFNWRKKDEFDSLSAIIVDSDDIFDLPHGYKNIEYPQLTDLRLHKQGRFLKPLCYDPVFGLNTLLFKQKYPTECVGLYRSNQVQREEIYWIKWESLNLKKFSMKEYAHDIAQYPTYAKGERVYCALTGVELFGDCYIFEIRHSETVANHKVCHIALSPIYNRVQFNIYPDDLQKFRSQFRWLTLRSYCPTTVDMIINEYVDAKEAPLYRAIEKSIEPLTADTWRAKNTDGSDIILSPKGNLESILQLAKTHSETLLIYDERGIFDL